MTTTAIQTHREQMMKWLEKDKGYEFLTMAAHYIPVCPDDHFVRIMAIREYVKLNLISPAQDLLNFGVASGTSPDATFQSLPQEFKTVRDSLQNVQSTPERWSDYTPQYESNLNALEERGFDTSVIRTAWTKRKKWFELFKDNNHLYQLRRRDERGLWFWIPALRNHTNVDDAQALPDNISALTPGPYAFEGLGLGRYFERVYEATKDTFLGFSCALIVVERDAAAMAALFHLKDWRELLSDPRVMLFVGENWAGELQHTMDENFDLPIPIQVFTTGPRLPNTPPHAVDIVQQSVSTREKVTLKSLDAVEKQYASRDIHYWADRFEKALSGKDQPLRIMGIVSTHTSFLQYSMRDAKRAIESLGHQCVVVSEKSSYDSVSTNTYHQRIQALDPDLVFVLDHIRPEFANIVPKNLPILSWDQDQLPHVFTPEKVAGISPIDFVVGYSKQRCIQLGCNPDQLLYVQMPTCEEQFGGDPLTQKEIEKYTCDVSYVSHASQTPQAFHEEERSQYKDPAVVRLLDTLFEMLIPKLIENRGPHSMLYYTAIEEAKRQCDMVQIHPDLNQRLSSWYMWRLGDRLFRHEALAWVSQWATNRNRSLRIYGNGWEHHPTLSAFAAGPAENGRELVCIYRASKINLQLMPSGFIHQRALDGLAADGFFLTRNTTNDKRGKLIQKLVRRAEELDITDSFTLVKHPDFLLKAMLREFFGEWLAQIDPNEQDVLNGLKIANELHYPDQVFSQFDQIAFDSEITFQRLADRHLGDEDRRKQITCEMRKVVIERFSYRSTMDHFLQSMAEYFRKVCD